MAVPTTILNKAFCLSSFLFSRIPMLNLFVISIYCSCVSSAFTFGVSRFSKPSQFNSMTKCTKLYSNSLSVFYSRLKVCSCLTMPRPKEVRAICSRLPLPQQVGERRPSKTVVVTRVLSLVSVA
jgi:hypothetical protein